MKKTVKKLILLALPLPAVVLFFFSLVPVVSAYNPESIRIDSAYELNYSDFPRIDAKAAYAERESSSEMLGNTTACRPDTRNMLLIVFSAYLFLLIFNFSFSFQKQKTPQWFWESLYTVLAIYAWRHLDGCFTDYWFPVIVIESWIIIFGFYLYIFFRSRIREYPVIED